MLRQSRILPFSLLVAAGCSSSPNDPASAAGKATAPPEAAGAASHATTNLDEWRRATSLIPMPESGCFKATYPGTKWEPLPCGTAPAGSLRPKADMRPVAPMTVGNGGDLSSQVTGNISWAEGSFPSVSGVTSVTNTWGYTAYSLQLNSNPFNSPLCAGAAPGCQGWEQFIYEGNGGAYIEYWLLNYGQTCPAGWQTFGGSCKIDSPSVAAPAEPVTNLAAVSMIGTIIGGKDAVIVSAGGSLYSMLNPSVLGLASGWTTAEFNVFGDIDGDEAYFNHGSTIVVQTLTDSVPSTTSAPACASTGFTGETNNLDLVAGSCVTFGGTNPGIQFTESNASEPILPGVVSVSRPITAVSRGVGLIDVLYRGADQNVHTKQLTSSGWGVDTSLGGQGAGNPTLVTRGSSRMDAFQIDQSGGIQTASWTPGGSWTTWGTQDNPAGGSANFLGGLVGVSSNSNRIDLFGSQGSLYTDSWSGTEWSSYVPLTSQVVGIPAVASSAPWRLDVLYQGTDQALHWKYWNGHAWNPSMTTDTQLGTATFEGQPAVASWGQDRMDVLVRGTDQKLYWRSWNGSTWNSFAQVAPQQFVGDPFAVSWGPNRIDVFVHGTDDRLYWNSYNGSAWSGYSQVGSQFIVGDPTAVTWGPNRLDVFVEGTDGELYTKSWDGTNWGTFYENLGGFL